MDAAKLRPLGIGEVLDAGIKIYRARFRSLVTATTIVIAPVYVLFALAQLSLTPDDEDFGTVDSTTGSGLGLSATPDAEEFFLVGVGLMLTGALMFLATQFATAVAVKIVAGAYLGEESSWRKALRAVWSRGWTIVWLSVLFGLFLLAGGGILVLLFAVLGTAVGVVAAIAMFFAAAYLYGSWMVTVPVLMMEGVSAWRSLGRSRRLVRKRWWPVVVSVVLAGLLAQVVMYTFSVVVIGLVAVGGNQFVENLASVLVSTAGAALTTPFIAAIVVVVYFDLRVRKEGFDLELLARSVGVAPDETRYPEEAQQYAPAPPPVAASGVDDPHRPPFWPPPPGWRPPDA